MFSFGIKHDNGSTNYPVCTTAVCMMNNRGWWVYDDEQQQCATPTIAVAVRITTQSSSSSRSSSTLCCCRISNDSRVRHDDDKQTKQSMRLRTLTHRSFHSVYAYNTRACQGTEGKQDTFNTIYQKFYTSIIETFNTISNPDGMISARG